MICNLSYRQQMHLVFSKFIHIVINIVDYIQIGFISKRYYKNNYYLK